MKPVFDISEFKNEVATIAKRGKATLALMEKMGATQERLNAEEAAIQRELLHARIKYTAQFGERLTEIIRDCSQ